MSQRDYSIDLMKGIITILMIVSHSMSFTGTQIDAFFNYVNLTTFSSFMFCFGYVCNIAYLQKEVLPWKKMLLCSLKTFGAYFLSAFMYSIFVEKNLSLSHILNLLTLKWVAGYSEFLLSWAYLYLLMIVCMPMLRKAAKNKYLCFALISLSLIFTFINYSKIHIPWLGPILGGTSFCYFPLFQYFSYFLMGSYVSQNKITFNSSILALSFLLSVPCFVYIVASSDMPERWGPSLLWISGSYFCTYLYYIGVKTIKLPAILSKSLMVIGKRTLLFLLINNLLCFVSSFVNVHNQHYHIRLISLVVILAGSIFVPLLILKVVQRKKQKLSL